MEIPTVKVVKCRQNLDYPQAWIVEVKCPHCKKRHIHGGRGSNYPVYDETNNMRVSDCRYFGKESITYLISPLTDLSVCSVPTLRWIAGEIGVKLPLNTRKSDILAVLHSILEL